MSMRKPVIEDTIMGLGVFSDGDEFVDKAWDATTPAARAKWARKALEEDIDCIDAYILLSHCATTLGEQIALLRAAVLAGERVWAPHLKRKDMHWWSSVGTRPYMRGMHELGLALIDTEDLSGAEAIFNKLLKLNPNDNQGVRENQIFVYLCAERYGDVRKLCAKYPGDGLLATSMGLLACALADGGGTDAQRITGKIAGLNEHVLPMLKMCLTTRRRPLDSSADYMAVGGVDEAAGYIAFNWDAWAGENTRKRFLKAAENIIAAVENDLTGGRTPKRK
jgi:tetratricopeptide (TPR) repeat protein